MAGLQRRQNVQTNTPALMRAPRLLFAGARAASGIAAPRTVTSVVGSSRSISSPCDWPFAFTLSSEYYTRSPDPTENFEISKLYALSLLYDAPLQKFEKTDYFLAAGIGRLKVPDSGTRVDGDLVNLEAGLHWKRFDRFGFYGSLKYLYAQESTGGRKIIDFSETIFMLGVTYRFAL
jgi:hypothetical protein